MNKIFYNSTLKKYLVINQNNLLCNHCNKKFNEMDFILIVEKYSFKFKNLFPDTLEFYCKDCIKKVKLTHEQQPTKGGLVFNQVIENSIPYIPKPLDMVKGDMNNFEVAVTRIESKTPEKTIDKTKLVGRESWEGSTIGDSNYIEKCKEKDKPLLKSPEELKKELLGFKISIDHKDKELLE